MKNIVILVVVLLVFVVFVVYVDVCIIEVVFWFSGNLLVGVDWFELINIGISVVLIVGWKMDDDLVSFSKVVLMSGISLIVVGELVIFIESSDFSVVNIFVSIWFGVSKLVGL